MSSETDEHSNFWRWFEESVNQHLAGHQAPPDSIIEELDRRMARLGLSWELGPAPDGSDDWGFAVSFGADQERLGLAERVVRSAPDMPGCQVLLGKPPKLWSGALELPSSGEWARFECQGAGEGEVMTHSTFLVGLTLLASCHRPRGLQAPVQADAYRVPLARMTSFDTGAFVSTGQAYGRMEAGEIIPGWVSEGQHPVDAVRWCSGLAVLVYTVDQGTYAIVHDDGKHQRELATFAPSYVGDTLLSNGRAPPVGLPGKH